MRPCTACLRIFRLINTKKRSAARPTRTPNPATLPLFFTLSVYFEEVVLFLAIEDKAGAASHLVQKGGQVSDPPDEAPVAVEATQLILLLTLRGQPRPRHLLFCTQEDSGKNLNWFLPDIFGKGNVNYSRRFLTYVQIEIYIATFKTVNMFCTEP